MNDEIEDTLNKISMEISEAIWLSNRLLSQVQQDALDRGVDWRGEAGWVERIHDRLIAARIAVRSRGTT